MSLTNSSLWFSSGAGGGSFYPYTIDQSLRFNDDSSAYLSWTPAVAGNRKTWTWSGWVKRGNLGSYQRILQSTSTYSDSLLFNTDDTIIFWGSDASTWNLKTSAQFRDVSAWYHLVISVDTTQATSSDRIKIYVNGNLQSLSTASYPSQNLDCIINNTQAHYISGNSGSNQFLDGYLGEVNFIDGQALDPTSFGVDQNGVWIPQAFAGSYGTNGFYLPFEVTPGDGVYLDGSGDNIRWTDATQYDISTSDDFCLEFFSKGDFENNYSYGIGYYGGTGGPYFMLGLGSGGNIYGYYGNGASNFFDATAFMTTTDWHHIAYVRESGTYRFYIDGVQRYSATAGGTVAFDTSQFNIGDGFPAAGAPHFKGFLSNLRFTIGSARYTGGTTFTVPTTTLTNDSSDVKMLAFTTSTITADGSNAAIAGSVTEGNPTYTEDNPFSDGIGTDASGNSNDFASNNLDFSDVLLDSPTNNFYTLSPLLNALTGPPTFREGNLSALFSSGSYENGAYSSAALPSSGQWYTEVYVKAAGGSPGIGLQQTNKKNYTSWRDYWNYTGPGSYSNQMPVYYFTGSVYHDATLSNKTVVSGLPSWTTGDIIGIAVDVDTNEIWFSKNGTFINSGNPATNANPFLLGSAMNPSEGDVVHFHAMSYQSGDYIFNFGQDSTFAGNQAPGNNADANGIGNFKYAPPSGYLALCTANLPDVALGPDVNTSDERANENFVPYLYTGDGASTRSFTGMGFSPDWLWNKCRTIGFSNQLYDTVRGPNKGLQTNTAGPENSYTLLPSFDTDGFTVDTDGTAGNVLNQPATTYATWSWKAGGAPTATNTAGVGAVPTSGSVLIDGAASTAALAGTIAANKISANTDAGFSIINYTGNGLSGQTVAHGLSSTPDFIIHKDRNTNSNNNQWNAWHKYAGDGDEYGYLSVTNAFTGDAQIIPNGTDTIELKANLTTTNQSGHSFIMYAFHSVDGFSKAGSYNGNGSTNGAFVHTGFRPAFVLLKKSSAAGDNWSIYDTGRDPYNVATKYLIPNSSQTEGSTTSLDFVSNGFKIRASGSWINTASATYIYMAFAENPFKYANAR